MNTDTVEHIGTWLDGAGAGELPGYAAVARIFTRLNNTVALTRH